MFPPPPNQPLTQDAPSRFKSGEEVLAASGTEVLFDENFKNFLENKVKTELPQEKADASNRQIKTAQELQKEGSVISKVMGQKLGTIDARIYHRFNQEFPGCWRDPEFVHAFFYDNPQFRNRGWRPKAFAVRKGVVYQNGQPITPHKGLAP